MSRLEQLLTAGHDAVVRAERLLVDAQASVLSRVAEGGKLSNALLESEQHAVHGLAWLATYVQALREMVAYAARMSDQGLFGEVEDLLTRIGLGEYLAQIIGGIPMNQGEILRLSDLGLSAARQAEFSASTAISELMERGNSPANRARLVALIHQQGAHGTVGNPGLDETMEAIRDEMRKFAAAEGLTMFLADKPRGTDAVPFPAPGMKGGEIEVLGYRGMKEYEIGFDGFEVKAENVLGGVEGQGFKQLMQTFESARIQTAARAVGVAQSAFDLGLQYAKDRIQFGKALIHFPRVADKLAMMAVEIHISRQITYFAGRAKDEDKRCDIEAGMAKLLGARVAWAAADNALQIHGGNGFALEYAISRVLCDARILNIFEGAAEIQAQVIGRRLLEGN
eukprot:gene10076-10145_t